MTANFSKSISPDSLTGMIFAAEGIKNAVVLLNGPMGCKFYHSTTSKFLSVRPMALLPSETGENVPVDYNFLDNYFFRQERVPCTYLDGYDYVYGTSQKVKEALLYLKEKLSFDLITIVNSPGASLIGDQLVSLAKEILPEKPCVILESPGFSESFDAGYEDCALEILKQTKLSGSGKKKSGKSVNILGLSIWDRYNEGDLKELTRLLSLCGINVNCALCSGSSLEEIKNIPDADLNVVINPRSGALCAKYLKDEYGMENYICPYLPIGFEETKKLFEKLCGLLGCDGSFVFSEIEKARALSWYKINDIYQISGKPNGTLFAVSGSPAQAIGFSLFFASYLGMNADCIETQGNLLIAQKEILDDFCEEYRAAGALKKNILDTEAELVFADANTIASLSLKNKGFCGIEISLPGMGYTDLIPKTHLGINGSLFLVEQVLNGLMSKL